MGARLSFGTISFKKIREAQKSGVRKASVGSIKHLQKKKNQNRLIQSDKMALQMPSTSRMQITSSHPTTTPLAPPTGANVGLRRPSDRFALRSSFFSPSVQLLVSHPQQPQTQTAAPRFSMRVASKQSYICRDCGYIYNDKSPFEKLPDNYYCPVCGAPKRRFKPYTPAVSKNANATDVRKARKEELKRDEAVGQVLPTAIAVGVLFLAGLYFYLNSTF